MTPTRSDLSSDFLGVILNPRKLTRHPTVEEAFRFGVKKERTQYNRGQGADIRGGRRVIEVETEATVRDGLRQLQGYQKPVYIAGADEEATQAALKATNRHARRPPGRRPKTTTEGSQRASGPPGRVLRHPGTS